MARWGGVLCLCVCVVHTVLDTQYRGQTPSLGLIWSWYQGLWQGRKALISPHSCFPGWFPRELHDRKMKASTFSSAGCINFAALGSTRCPPELMQFGVCAWVTPWFMVSRCRTWDEEGRTMDPEEGTWRWLWS